MKDPQRGRHWPLVVYVYFFALKVLAWCVAGSILGPTVFLIGLFVPLKTGGQAATGTLLTVSVQACFKGAWTVASVTAPLMLLSDFIRFGFYRIKWQAFSFQAWKVEIADLWHPVKTLKILLKAKRKW